MTPDPTISVAMATFNGARYLREQLDSIARQSYLPKELVVGDDRSTDETVDIIADFAKSAPFPVHVEVNVENLGYGDNFLEAAARCRSDWIAFCDQDDVWCESKLELVRQAITASKADDLVLVLHQARSVDDRLEALANAAQLPYQPKRRATPRRGHKCFWLYKGVAQVVRRDIITEFDRNQRPKRIYDPKQPLSHDAWTSLIANAIGSTYYIDVACLLYRRHDSNVSPVSSVTRRSTADRITKVVTSNLEDFQLRAATARCVQRYLEALSEKAPQMHRVHLLEHADDYRRHCAVLENRVAILSDVGTPKKLTAWAKTIRAGGYFERNNFGFTHLAMLKDLAKIFKIV